MALSYRLRKTGCTLKSNGESLVLKNTDNLRVIEVIKNPPNDPCFSFHVICEYTEKAKLHGLRHHFYTSTDVERDNKLYI